MRSIIGRLFLIVSLAAALLGVWPLQNASAGGLCYVKAGAAGTHTGTSWVSAYDKLQSALSNATCTEIWVTKGSYYPTTGTGRAATFTLKNGVALYGGFVGTETARTQRNPTLNQTNLSGDIGTTSTYTDDSYHVVTASGTNSTAVLDGFAIMYGNANGAAYPNNVGGGLYNNAGSPTLANLVFAVNSASYGGGGMFDYNASPTLSASTFFWNTSSGFAAGLEDDFFSSPKLTNITFNNNIASGYGGAMYTYYYSNPVLNRVTFSANQASDGAGMYVAGNSAPSLTNVIFNANVASNNGGGMVNDNANPSLLDVTFSANTANNNLGGGIYNLGTDQTLTNVTFSGNAALGGGGIYNDTASFSSTVTLTNVTFSANTAVNAGGGMYNTDAGLVLTLNDVILWGNTSPLGTDLWDASAAPVIKDSILQNGCPIGSSCTNVITANPLLTPLGKYGGFAPSLGLGMGSAAIDAGGANAACAATDQRGTHRPQGVACDIGAFEVVNLSDNGGFNIYSGTSKIPTGWTAALFSPADGRDTTFHKEGSASVKLTGNGAAKALAQTLAVSGTSGSTLAFSFWARGNSIPAAGLCRGQALIYNGATLVLTKTLPCATGTYGAFHKKTVTFTTSSAFTKVVIKFTYSEASGTVWFDAVSLMR